MATGEERVVTAKLPADLVARLDNVDGASNARRVGSYAKRFASGLRERKGAINLPLRDCAISMRVE
jgi:hypothetical protein